MSEARAPLVPRRDGLKEIKDRDGVNGGNASVAECLQLRRSHATSASVPTRPRARSTGPVPVKLLNAHLAVVERHKVVGYLLNSAHPDNGGKARFFESLGFSVESPELLMKALRGVGQNGDVVESVESSHGEKYVVDGSISLQTETRHSRMVRTVWIIDSGSESPRLVTAYPGQE